MTDPDLLRTTLIQTTAELLSTSATTSNEQLIAEAVDLIVAATLEHAAVLLTAAARALNPDPDDWGDDLGQTFAADGLDAGVRILRAEITSVTDGNDARLLASITRLEAPHADSAVRLAALAEAAAFIEQELPLASGGIGFGDAYAEGVTDATIVVRRLAGVSPALDLRQPAGA